LAATLALAAASATSAFAQGANAGLSQIQTVVVIYAENRAFDNLYGTFPGAVGLADAHDTAQLDRDGKPLKELPPAWGGLTAKDVTPAITQEQSAHLPNQPFALDDPSGFNAGLAVTTRDLWHRFYENQMQINGGRNNMFAAWADSGALTMGHYDGRKLPMWPIVQKYELLDNFFMGAFGGSFLNHQYLACACAPGYPHAGPSEAPPPLTIVEANGVTLKIA